MIKEYKTRIPVIKKMLVGFFAPDPENCVFVDGEKYTVIIVEAYGVSGNDMLNAAYDAMDTLGLDLYSRSLWVDLAIPYTNLSSFLSYYYFVHGLGSPVIDTETEQLFLEREDVLYVKANIKQGENKE